MIRERVGVVAVNWNDAEATAICLGSVIADSGDAVIPIVVDNASDEDPTRLLASRVPDVRVVRLATNRGYAAGCNAGASEALRRGATHILLLNNDLVVERGAIEALLDASHRYPDAILAPLVVHADRPQIVWSAGAQVSRPWMQNRHLGEGEPRDSIRGGPVDWAPGCALFVTDQTWSGVGPLDESYFLYLEDLDWCLQARRHRLQVRCVAEAVVRHSISRTSSRALTDAAVYYYGCRNTHRVAWKHNAGALRALVRITAAWSVLKGHAHAAVSPALRRDPLHRARLRALSDFLRGIGGASTLDQPSAPQAAGSDGLRRAG